MTSRVSRLCVVDSGASGVLSESACAFSEWDAFCFFGVAIEATTFQEFPDGVTDHGAGIAIFNIRDCFQLREHAPSHSAASCEFERRTMAALVKVKVASFQNFCGVLMS